MGTSKRIGIIFSMLMLAAVAAGGYRLTHPVKAHVQSSSCPGCIGTDPSCGNCHVFLYVRDYIGSGALCDQCDDSFPPPPNGMSSARPIDLLTKNGIALKMAADYRQKRLPPGHAELSAELIKKSCWQRLKEISTE